MQGVAWPAGARIRTAAAAQAIAARQPGRGEFANIAKKLLQE
jgi:hypothetical protein